MRVLIIEDDPDIRSALAQALEEAGYEIAEADNGRTGLAALELQAPDLIVVDMFMPVMDGFAFLAETSSRPAVRDVPVVVITASAKVPAVLDRVTRVLRKPFDLQALLDAIQDAAARSPR